MRFGLGLEWRAVALRNIAVIRAVRQVVNLAIAVAGDWPGRRLRRLHALRFHGPTASPVIPRRYLLPVGPHPAPPFPGARFGLLVCCGVFAAQLDGEEAMEPRHAAIDLLKVNVASVERSLAEPDSMPGLYISTSCCSTCY